MGGAARGYKGHQHLSNFGIINMNGRLYDLVLGRMLSPDPYIQLPGFAQNYNRYSYVLNNPLKYTDPDGEWIAPVLTALLNMYWNGVTSNGFQFNPAKWDWSNPSTYGNLALGAYNGYQIGANLEGSYKNVSGAQTGSSKPVWSEEFQSYLVPETVADFKYVRNNSINLFERTGGINEDFARRIRISMKNFEINEKIPINGDLMMKSGLGVGALSTSAEYAENFFIKAANKEAANWLDHGKTWGNIDNYTVYNPSKTRWASNLKFAGRSLGYAGLGLSGIEGSVALYNGDINSAAKSGVDIGVGGVSMYIGGGAGFVLYGAYTLIMQPPPGILYQHPNQFLRDNTYISPNF